MSVRACAIAKTSAWLLLCFVLGIVLLVVGLKTLLGSLPVWVHLTFALACLPLLWSRTKERYRAFRAECSSDSGASR